MDSILTYLTVKRAPVVLYVEDEENDLLFMQRAFNSAGLSKSLVQIHDGSEAMAYLKGESPYDNRVRHPLPSLVLLDLNLPGISGLEVLVWIRAHPEFQRLPVIMFSSSSRPEDIAKASELGAAGYLEKPNSGTLFPAIVERLKNEWKLCGC